MRTTTQQRAERALLVYVMLTVACTSLLAALLVPDAWGVLVDEWLGPFGLAVLSAILVVLVVLLAVVATRYVRREVDVDLDARLSDLALIDALNAAANAGESREDLLLRLEKDTKKTFQSRGANVYMLEPTGEYLTVLTGQRETLNEAGVSLPAGMSHPRIKLADSSWYGGVLASGEPRITDDFDEIVAMARDFEGSAYYAAVVPAIVRGLGVGSVMTAPIVSGERTVGLIDVSRAVPFTDDELERLHVIGQEMASILGRIDAEEALRHSEAEAKRQVRQRTAQLETALGEIAVYSQMQHKIFRNVSH